MEDVTPTSGPLSENPESREMDAKTQNNGVTHHTLTLEYALYPNDSEVTSCFCSCDWQPEWGDRNGLLIEECAAQFSQHVGTVAS